MNRLGSRREFAFAEENATELRERLHLADVLKQRETAKEVRAFAVAPVVRRRWEQRYASYLAAARCLVAARTKLAVAGALATGALFLLTLLFLVWRVRTGAVGLGQAAAAVVAMRLLASRLQTLAGGASSLFEARLFVLDLHRFLDAAPPDRPAHPGPPVPMFSRLEVRDVGTAIPAPTASRSTVCRWRSAAARSSRWSARTARARPRSRRSSRASSTPLRGRSSGTAT